MDIKSKIDRCRSIIIENIIIDNNFIKKIDQLKVLPASIIEDIKNQESKIIKVEILLEALAIQHCNKWELFCNALQISGQKFLTYVIREENDIMEENCKKIVEDSINKYTNIGKYISLQEKSKLARCLSEKIKAQLLFEIYNGCIEEKEKTMKAREIHIYDIIKYIDTIRNHEKKMCDISYEAKQLQNKSDQTELELKNKDDELNELRRNSFERLKIKHRYHKANENQLSRLTNRLGSIKNFVQNLNKKICETVASETEKHYQDATIKKEYRKMSLPEEIKSLVIEESKDLNNFFETDLQKNIEHLIDRVKSLEMQVDNFASYKVQNIELSRQLSLSLNEKCDKIKDFEKYIATLNRQMEMSKCSNDIDALQFIPLNSIQLTKDSNLSNLNEKFHKYYQKYEKKYSDLCTSSMETSNKLIWFLISKINQEISNNQKTVSNIQNDKNKILKNLNSMKCENDRLHKFIKDVKTRRLSENVSNNTNQYNKNRRNTVAHLEKIIDNSVEIKMISQLSKDKDDIKCLFEKENKIVKNENKKKVINKFNI